jgi:AraC-like DNA-binding protein
MANFINFIILFGVVQGFVLSLVLFFSNNNRQVGKHFLSILLLILVYNGLETLNWSAGWNSALFVVYTYTLIFGIGPSIYFYVKSFSQPQQIAFKQVYPHYLPVLIQFLLRSFLLLHWVLADNQALTIWLDGWHARFVEPLSVIFAGIYISLSFLEYQRWKAQNDLLTLEKSLIIKWLNVFFKFMFLLLLLWTLSLFANYFLPELPYFSYYYPTEILLVILIYWIGFTGYHQIYIIQITTPKPESLILNDFSENEIQAYIASLKNAMEKEKLYLDNELTVNKLANYLKINAKTISAILNQQLHKGFNEFVNEYRVEEVKKQLLSPDNQHLTITGIALEAGFNSQATFQRVFKNLVGMTPSEYLAQNQALKQA